MEGKFHWDIGSLELARAAVVHSLTALDQPLSFPGAKIYMIPI